MLLSVAFAQYENLAASEASDVDSYFDQKRAEGKKIVSIGGFSGAGYEDEAAAERELEKVGGKNETKQKKKTKNKFCISIF